MRACVYVYVRTHVHVHALWHWPFGARSDAIFFDMECWTAYNSYSGASHIAMGKRDGNDSSKEVSVSVSGDHSAARSSHGQGLGKQVCERNCCSLSRRVTWQDQLAS